MVEPSPTRCQRAVEFIDRIRMLRGSLPRRASMILIDRGVWALVALSGFRLSCLASVRDHCCQTTKRSDARLIA